MKKTARQESESQLIDIGSIRKENLFTFLHGIIQRLQLWDFFRNTPMFKDYTLWDEDIINIIKGELEKMIPKYEEAYFWESMNRLRIMAKTFQEREKSKRKLSGIINTGILKNI